MNHTYYKELVCLSACGELEGEDVRKLEEHLSGCAECRTELAQMKQLSAAARHSSVEVSDELLREARAELHAELLKLKAREPFAERAAGRVKDLFGNLLAPFTMRPAFAAALGAVVMTAFGVLIGYALFSPAHGTSGQTAMLQQPEEAPGIVPAAGSEPSTVQALEQGGARVENIRIIHADESKGVVEFVYEAVTPVRVSGSLKDKNVQKVLARALVEEQNDGVRLRAMDVINSAPGGETAEGDAGIRNALATALKTDENPAVRRQAVLALQKFPADAQVQRALVYALMHDKNAGVRVAAVNALAEASMSGRTIAPDVLESLRTTAQNDKNIFIRNQSRNVLEEASLL